MKVSRQWLILAVSPLFFIANQSYSQNGTNEFIWSPTDSIEWSDFQGKPDSTRRTFDARFAKALTVTGIKFIEIDSLSDRACYDVKTVFYCSDSWKTGTTHALLNHERGHFDLMEVHARKLRKRLFELARSCKTSSIDEELNLVLDQYDTVNDQYDEQTMFGTNIMNQDLWDEKIKNELLELEEYSSGRCKICLCE